MVCLDGVDGAPNFGDSREMLGELGFRNCEEALRGFLMGGKSPGRPRKRWREMERVEGIEPNPICHVSHWFLGIKLSDCRRGL